MSTNTRSIAGWLLGAALVAMPCLAAAAERGASARGALGGRGEGEFRAAPRTEFQPTPSMEFRGRPSAQFQTTPGAAFRGNVGGAANAGARAGSWNQTWAQQHPEANRNWIAGRQGNWNNWNRWNGRGWGGWNGWGWGLGYPWYGSNWWPGYGYGWYPGYAGYGWYGSRWPGYYGGYSSYEYPYYGGYGYETGQYATPYTAAYPPSGSPTATAQPANQTAESQFYDQAVAAFQGGDYRNAMRLASHAAIDNPQDPRVHVLLSLAMFATGDYRGAAMEAHGLAAMGKIPDWNMVYSLYGNEKPYEDQLRALEKFVTQNPSAPEGRFLLGFQYTVTGHNDAAQPEFLAALKAAPEDRIAAELLKHTGGTVPADIAQRLAQPPQGAPGAPGQGTPPASTQPMVPPAPTTRR